MAVDYDLVVIGSTPEAIYAASAATYLNARVALVEQPFPGHLGSSEAICRRTLSQMLLNQKIASEEWQLGGGKYRLPTPDSLLPLAKSWTGEVISILTEQNSSAILAALGVDVISGAGEFCRLPQQAFIVNNRRLRSRAYLMATGSRPIIPQLEGLQEMGYLTPADLWKQEHLESLANDLLIVGESLEAIELAQSLRRLGKEVTLVVERDRILPSEDLEVSMLIQAQLEAEGIKLLTQSPVVQLKRIEDKKWVQAGNRAIAADEIILATAREPNVEGLNLEGVGVKFSQQRIQLNQKLQTANPRIYACGGVAGSSFSNIAQYEASIALKNALFFPLYKVNYHGISWAIFTDPQVAGVGMTEAQARRRYGKDVFVVRQYFKHIPLAQVLGEATGFCKLVVRGNGNILGAYIVGAQAGELIGAIALAIRNKIKVGAMADFFPPSLTLSEIVHQTAIEWQHQRLRRNKRLRNFLETLFIWRRSWSS